MVGVDQTDEGPANPDKPDEMTPTTEEGRWWRTGSEWPGQRLSSIPSTP